MQSCQHVFYQGGCGGCEASRVYGDMAAQSREQHKERMKAFDRDRRDQNQQIFAAPRPAQPRQPLDVVGTLKTAGVLAAVLVACVLYVIASTLLFALMPVFAVAAVGGMVAKKLHKPLPGALDRMSWLWWGGIVAVAVVARVFHSDPVRPPIVNITNLALFVATVAAGFWLYQQYRREADALVE